MDRAKGIDVSYYQKEIDWKQVAAAGYTFAFIRASYVGTKTGNYRVDSKFVDYWSKAQAAGLLLTAFHYFVPQLGSTSQIDHFLDAFGQRERNFPLALDFENAVGLPKEQVTQCINEAVQLMETCTGQKPIVYTRASWWRRFVVPSSSWADHHLWVANYENPNGPLMPPGWAEWRFWQWSERGTVPGISTMVDLDWYNGSEADLRQYAGVG